MVLEFNLLEPVALAVMGELFGLDFMIPSQMSRELLGAMKTSFLESLCNSQIEMNSASSGTLYIVFP